MIPHKSGCVRGQIGKDFLIGGLANFKQNRVRMKIAQLEPSELDVVDISLRGAQVV